MSALKYWVWLQTLENVSLPAKLALLEHFSSVEEIYFAGEEEYLQVEGFRAEQAAALCSKSLERAQQVLSDCAKEEAFIVTMEDALYPVRLRNIFDPPLLLYGKGRMPLFDEEVALTMVGTRRCTPYGVQTAEELGYELARQGAMVISGMAKGIDSAALRGALRSGSFTAAVLGGGVDVVYPAENRWLYEDIAATGVLLSEYPPHTEAEGWHFPQRNRIMSGLSLGTVVVEAPAVRSGALITAHDAAEQGKDVFAVPGPINAPMSGGCHQLIREGAMLVTSAWDILEDYVPRYPHKLRKAAGTLPPMPAGSEAEAKPLCLQEAPAAEKPQSDRPVIDPRICGIAPEQLQILRQLSPEVPLLTDEVAEKAGYPMRLVLSALTMLEIEGYVTKSGARAFVRTVDIQEENEDMK